MIFSNYFAKVLLSNESRDAKQAALRRGSERNSRFFHFPGFGAVFVLQRSKTHE